jgi:hypothetical protein
MANRDSAIGTGAHVASHVIGGVNKVVGAVHKTARRFGKGVGHVIKRAYEEDAASLPGRHIHIHVHDAATARTNDPGIAGTMHEFKHGTLHSGSKKGPKVKSRKQAIAIALSKQRRGDGKDDIDLGRISATGDERRRTMGGKDYGTPEGAKKAAQSRKSSGGQVTVAHSHTAGYHEQRARQLMDTPTNNNYVHGMALKRAATLHRQAAHALKTKAPNARKLSERAHSFARQNFLHMS